MLLTSATQQKKNKKKLSKTSGESGGKYKAKDSVKSEYEDLQFHLLISAQHTAQNSTAVELLF